MILTCVFQDFGSWWLGSREWSQWLSGHATSRAVAKGLPNFLFVFYCTCSGRQQEWHLSTFFPVVSCWQILISSSWSWSDTGPVYSSTCFVGFVVFFFPSAFLPFVFQYFFSSCQHLLFFLQCPVLPSYSLSSIAFPLEGLFRTSDIITSGFTYMSNVKYFDKSWKMSPFGHFSSVRDVFKDSIVLKVCSQLFYVSFLPDLVEVGQLVQCLIGKNWQPDIKNPFPLEIVYYLFVFLLFQP